MNIANALRATFSIEEQKAIERRPTSSSEAYALFLQARALPLSATDLAIELLDRAIAIDANFADAYASKAARLSANLTNTAFGNGARPEARAAIEQAIQESVARSLALEPGNARALATLAARDVQYWRWSTIPIPKAETQASLFTPASVWVQAWKGDVAQILRVSERWAEIDPKTAGPFVNLGVLYAYAGDRDASDRAFRRALEIAPASPLVRAYLGYNAAARGDAEGTLREFGKVQQLLGDNVPVVFMPEMAYAYSRIGRVEEARKLFAKLEAAAQQANLGAGAWALGYLAIGDDANALRQLEAVAEKARNHEPDPSYLNVMNLKMNFLADPRMTRAPFAEVLEKIKGS
jgi:tetratricopeptide (TPR) repeat protein